MKLKNVIGLIVFIFVFIIACAGASEKSETEQLTEENESSNLNEPWTGTWKVSLGSGWQMGIVGDYELKLKQDGNQVKSLIGSSYNFKGKGDAYHGAFGLKAAI